MIVSRIYIEWLVFMGVKQPSYRVHLERITKRANGKRFIITIKPNYHRENGCFIRAFYYISFKTKIYKL